MRAGVLAAFHDFQKVLVLCPVCGEVHRLSELKLSYRGRVKHTWLDTLRAEERQIENAEQRYKEQQEAIKQRAREAGQRQVPKILKKCVPAICSRGYYPQDLKAIFDPVDFVIFDGMKQQDRIKKVVLFDGPPDTKRRSRAQSSIRKVLKKGNYDWKTVKLDKEGKIYK